MENLDYFKDDECEFCSYFDADTEDTPCCQCLKMAAVGEHDEEGHKPYFDLNEDYE